MLADIIEVKGTVEEIEQSLSTCMNYNAVQKKLDHLASEETKLKSVKVWKQDHPARVVGLLRYWKI